MAGGITDLQVTYATALGAPKFHRVTTKTHQGADINKGRETPVFLWYLKGIGDPIVEIRVLYDDEEVPEGFKKVRQDLTKGAEGKSAYLAFRAGKEGPDEVAITAVTVNYSDESPGEGFIRVERSLNHNDEDPSWLWYRHRSAEDEAAMKDMWTADKLAVGDWFECRDTYGKWCNAQVLAISDDKITVRYRDWGPKWDEEIPKTSPRLAELGTHGDLSAPKALRQGEEWTDLDSKQAENIDSKMVAFMAGEMEGEEAETYIKTELPDTATRLMRSSYPSDGAGDEDPKSAPEIANSLLQRLHEVVVHHMKKDERMPRQIEEIFARLFLSDKKCNHFFESYGACPPNKPMAAKVNGKFARIPGGGASRFFVTNMNHFGGCGGYDAVLARINHDPPIEISELEVILTALAICKFCYNPEWAKDWLADMQVAISKRLAAMTDTELKETKQQTINNMLLNVRVLYETALREHNGKELVEKLTLGFAARLIRCEFLNKRLTGETQIIDKVKLVDEASRGSFNPHYRDSRRRDTPSDWLTTEVLSAWITEHRVVEVLLGGEVDGKTYSTHVEIIKRLPDLFRFLCSEGKLEKANVKLLWDTIPGGGDALRREVFTIIADLASVAPLPMVDWMYDELVASVDELDEVAFLLIRRFTEFALMRNATRRDEPSGDAEEGGADGAAEGGADGDAGDAGGAASGAAAGGDAPAPADAGPVSTSTYGLDLLWSVLQDEADVSAEVAEMAQTTLVEILRRPELRAHSRALLMKCVSNLADNKSVPQSLDLARALVQSLPWIRQAADGERGEGDDPETRDEMLNDLEGEFELANLLVNNVARYCTTAAESAAKRGVGPDMDATATALVGRTPHAVQVERRLDFLRFHVNFCDAELDLAGVTTLWGALCEAPVAASDKEDFLEWLRGAAAGETDSASRRAVQRAFTEDVEEQIFTDLLCSSDKLGPSTLGPKGLGCLQYFFLSQNSRAGKVVASTSSMQSFRVRDVALAGLDTLWQVVLQNTHEEAQREASDFLVRLFARLHPATDAGAVWETFVENVMKQIGDATAVVRTGGPGAASAEHRVEMLMRVLTSFLAEVDTSAGELELSVELYHQALPQQQPRPKESLKLKVRPSSTIGEVRDMVARRVNHPANKLRLLRPEPASSSSGRSATVRYLDARHFDDLTLTEARLTSINAVTMLEPSPDTSDHVATAADEVDEDGPNPRAILSNSQDYFELLFSLLSLPSASVVNDSWELLQQLPTNSKIQDDIYSLGGAVGGSASVVPWTRILDGGSILRLLYSLQIVDHIVSPKANMNSAELETQTKWCDTFVSLGGFTHLHSVLMGIDVEAAVAGSLPKTCLTLLLKLVCFFMVVPEQYSHLQSTKEFAADLDFGAMVTRLLKIIDVTARSNPGDPPKSAAEAALPAANTVKEVVDTTVGGDSESKGKEAKAAASAAAAADAEEKAEPIEVTSEAHVVRYGLNLLVAILVQKRETLAALYKSPTVSDLFVFALLHTGDAAVRVETGKGIYQLCSRFAQTVDEADAKAAGEGPAITSPSDFFLQLLFDEVAQLYKFADRTDQYVALVRRLLKGGATAAVGAGAGSASESGPLGSAAPAIVTSLAKAIVKHPIVESNEDESDYVLRGLLQMTAAILRRRPDLKASVGVGGDEATNLVDHLFDQGLFAIASPESRGRDAPPKCKSARTRKQAFLLLAELARDAQANNARLCELVVPHHASPLKKKKKKKKSVWDFYTRDENKSSTGYVGLKNLGCICYMNSSMQQFFMVPEFRRGMLKFEDDEDDKSESMMYQMQRMFAYLQESEKQYFNPKGFCNAFKDYSGEPTNTMVQKDASEYLGMLFQQIETRTMGSEQEKLLKNVFGGTLCNELIADGHYSERDEPFQFISVNVKNRRNLDEALREFISGEQVDYKWEEPDGSKVEVPTTKRQSLKVLPPHLIVHLKRFEFDYETLRQVKLNDRFEFPRELNLKKFTKEGRPDPVKVDGAAGAGAGGAAAAAAPPDEPTAGASEAETKAGDVEPDVVHPDEYYEYELMGVVVHTGTADSGHYYSFIRERDYEPLAEGEEDHRRWLCFNDQWVSNWDDADMERECFGGEESYRVNAYTNAAGRSVGGYTTTSVRHRNGFVLFYDRKRPKKVVERAPTGEAMTKAAMGGSIRAGVVASKLLSRHRARKAMLQHRSVVPPTIFDDIWAENLDFWHRKNVLDKSYFEFIWSLVSNADAEAVTELPAGGLADEAAAVAAGGPGLAVIRLTTLFIMQTLSSSKEKESLPQWNDMLKKLLKGNKVACVWLLQTMIRDEPKLREFLLESEDDEARSSMAEILSFVVSVVAPEERASYPAAGAPPLVVRAASAGASEGKGDDKASDSKGSEAASDSKSGGAAATAVAPGGGKEAEADTAGKADAKFLAPAGKTVAAFIEVLLDMLPDPVTENWRSMGEYFSVLNKFAAIGKEERLFLLNRGALGRVADFILGPESPHPEVSGGAPLKDPEADKDKDKDAEGAEDDGDGDKTKDTGTGPDDDASGAAAAAASSNNMGSRHVTYGPNLPGHRDITGNVGNIGRRKMGDAITGARMLPVFDLLATLCFSSEAIMGGTTPVNTEGEAAPLSDVDKRLLTCEGMFAAILKELSTYHRARVLQNIVSFFVWNNKDVNAMIAKLLSSGVEASYYSDLKPFFRALSLLVRVDDDLAKERVDMLLSGVLKGMKNSAKYYLATEECIRLLTRQARHSAAVAEWIAAEENVEKVAWVQQWLEDNPRPPAFTLRPAPDAVVLHKPRGYTQSGSNLRYDRPGTLLPNTKRMLKGAELVHDGYDSDDDPNDLVGRRVSVRWKENSWYEGVVKAYYPERGEHYVLYDDGDKKMYRMSEKVFVFVTEGDDDDPAGDDAEGAGSGEVGEEPAGGTGGNNNDDGGATPDGDDPEDPAEPTVA